eukprot:TRINITY_DN4078_c1_g1_i6.p3 TRINITY_DN4078_c1_g1~~TRINITY_DN4078_c1_g1_i6.p3  ORF type:complete len:145 (-),score=2.09 TRINITY_DN4078_c1_g1_i6:53-460(-)
MLQVQANLRCVRTHSRVRIYAERPAQPLQEVGRKVQPWLSSPFDALSFGPRLLVGSVLRLPSTLKSIPQDADRLAKLLQAGSTSQEKQSLILKELEELVVTNLQTGKVVEDDILTRVAPLLPSEVASLILSLMYN